MTTIDDAPLPTPAVGQLLKPGAPGFKVYDENQLRDYAARWCAAATETLRNDAERYRWLCAALGETQLPTLIERITQGYVADYKPSIDAAIDAAMSAAPAVGAA